MMKFILKLLGIGLILMVLIVGLGSVATAVGHELSARIIYIVGFIGFVCYMIYLNMDQP